MYSPTPLRSVPAVRGHRRVRPGIGARYAGPRHTEVAAEHRGAYDRPSAGPASSSSSSTASSSVSSSVSSTGAASPSEPPFGLPALAEAPALAGVLGRLRVADHALLDAVADLADLLADDTVEETTGVGIDHWLAIVAAQTRMDRRLLVRTCRLLHRLPTLRAAVHARRLSFAQLRGLTIGLRAARRQLDPHLDQLIACLLDELDRFDGADPDVLVRQVVDALDELDPDDLEAREQDAARNRFLHLQPRRDGTGGRVTAEVDAAGLALLDAATTPTAAAAAAAGGHGAARLDALLARVAGSVAPSSDDPDHAPTSDGTPGTPGTPGAPGAPGVPGTPGTDGSNAADALPSPKLLIRIPFEALFDGRVPADLLTTLVGGRLRLTSAAAREMLDRAGAQLRAVVLDDDGTIIGVGRATRQPPGFVSDALASIHDTCTGPGCDRPARGAQTDHARPWWPTRPDAPAGTTDLDNLGPLCATTNRDKGSAGWQVTQRRSGTRTWHHPRSGLTTTTIPATWRPPDDPRRRPPPRPVPPGATAPGPDDAAQEPPGRAPGQATPPDDPLPF